jgi:hypothetical protein
MPTRQKTLIKKAATPNPRHAADFLAEIGG